MPGEHLFTKSALIRILLVVSLLTTCCCNTYFYKKFIVDGGPRRPGEVVAVNGLTCGISLDAGAHDEVSFRDSVYSYWIVVSRYVSNCDESWNAAFATMDASETNLQLGTYMHYAIVDSVLTLEACQKYWFFRPVTISDSLSEATVHLKIKYTFKGALQSADTTVTLRRIKGKEREIKSF